MTAILRHNLLIVLVAVVCPMFVLGQNCNVQQLEGTYISTGTGYAYIFPYTSLGTVRANSQGVLSYSGVTVDPAGTHAYQSTDSWTVGPDCKITVTTQSGQISSGFAVNNGQEIRLLVVGPTPLQVVTPPYPPMPLVATTTLYRLSAGANSVNRCSLKDVTGTYAVFCNGWTPISLSPLAYLPQSYVGSMSSPGDGTTSGSGTAVKGFGAWPVTNTGRITLDPDCTGTGTNGAAETQRAAVFDEGKRIISIIDSGQSITMCQSYRLSKQ